MTAIDCYGIADSLVECARGNASPDVALAVHIRNCQACADRWEAERRLSSHLRAIRVAAAAQRSPETRREALMQRFAERRESRTGNRWLWSFAAAAAVLLALLLGQGVMRRPAAPVTEVAALSDAQADPDNQYDGFIPVPFVPPLASGELVRVVHTELYPAALASLGVNVDPAWNTEVPADLLMGQDGFPRAVRVSVDSEDQAY